MRGPVSIKARDASFILLTVLSRLRYHGLLALRSNIQLPVFGAAFLRSFAQLNEESILGRRSSYRYFGPDATQSSVILVSPFTSRLSGHNNNSWVAIPGKYITARSFENSNNV
jgi:hypothetical protein